MARCPASRQHLAEHRSATCFSIVSYIIREPTRDCSSCRLASTGPRVIQKSLLRETREMCRNIKTLANFAPPASDDEIRAAALQFVRKLSGTTRPSRANEAAFEQAVDDVTAAARRLIQSLETAAPPRDREVERVKAQARSQRRFGQDRAVEG